MEVKIRRNEDGPESEAEDGTGETKSKNLTGKDSGSIALVGIRHSPTPNGFSSTSPQAGTNELNTPISSPLELPNLDGSLKRYGLQSILGFDAHHSLAVLQLFFTFLLRLI